MNTTMLKRHFDRMGARVKVAGMSFARSRPFRSVSPLSALTLDIEKDSQGEYFLIRLSDIANAEIEVLDVRPAERHLLLMARDMETARKHKFLCGHDERAWFVAAIPEKANASSVRTAMEALKPEGVRSAQERARVKRRDRARRKTSAYARQGEWFFLPCPDMEVDPARILSHEPFSRGQGSKPHRAQECYRSGGELVYVCYKHPNGLTEAEFQRLDPKEVKRYNWEVRRRNMEVFARGRITHADHKTLVLPFWHRVEMNTENQAEAMRHVMFLD